MRDLTERDIKEGAEVAEMYARLPALEKKQASIYLQALADRNEIREIEDLEAAAG